MDHGGVIICFDDYEVSYRDARCVFCTRVVSFITRKKQELYPLLTSIIDLYLGLKGV
jgi:predicted DCC family thiol-disulfide oxidoreductase YuxK